MQTEFSMQSKPRAETYRPHLVRLVGLNPWRRLFRRLFIGLVRGLVAVCTRTRVIGSQNQPQRGPCLVVSNHLGDADMLVGMAISTVPVDTVAKVELYDLPLVGKLLDAYGVIWIHRGLPDRRAVRVALQALKAGRLVAIAPEGRESLTGSLEEGTQGAAFLALKSGAPLLPVTFTGTENRRIYANLKRLRRTEVTVTIGEQFHLENLPDHHLALDLGTRTIMQTLAAQLPPDYRGIYT
jgi:1-acyl-sn-glycerol-3-phosphate acyltransferase